MSDLHALSGGIDEVSRILLANTDGTGELQIHAPERADVMVLLSQLSRLALNQEQELNTFRVLEKERLTRAELERSALSALHRLGADPEGRTEGFKPIRTGADLAAGTVIPIKEVKPNASVIRPDFGGKK